MFKRKNKVSSLVVVLSLMLAVSGCGDDSTSSQTAFNQMFSKRGTIQGKIFDANTGEAISGVDLKITLIQGTQHRSPSLLITNETHPLAGEYAFADVPVELDNGNITYKMVVTKDGYQDFSGNVTLRDSGVQTIAGTTDTFFNRIANIYLFPLGKSAPAVDVVVEFNQEPVIGAEVQLVQNATANTGTAEIGNRLVSSLGQLPPLSAITDNQGVATFPSESLVLGGAYTPTVFSVKHGQIQLGTIIRPQIFVGISVTPVVVPMAEIEAGGQAFGLHVREASNRPLGSLTGLTNPGVLTLKFNRPVAIADDVFGGTPFTATLVNAGGSVLNNLPNNASSVTAVLSTDGLTLTLTPNFTTLPVAADTGLDVLFAGGLLNVVGEEGAGSNAVFGLSSSDGGIISNRVHVTAGP